MPSIDFSVSFVGLFGRRCSAVIRLRGLLGSLDRGLDVPEDAVESLGGLLVAPDLGDVGETLGQESLFMTPFLLAGVRSEERPPRVSG